MYKGGPSYTPQAAKAIRWAGLLVPIILISYGFYVRAGGADNLHYFGDLPFYSISFWWLFIGIVQFVDHSRSRRDSAMRLIAYHLLAAGYLLFVAGVATPFVAFWILLLLATNVYFSRSGVNLSILTFLVVAGVDIYFWRSNPTIIEYDLVTIVAIILSGLVTLSISKSQEVDHAELLLSKRQEAMQRDRVLTIVNNLADAILSTDKEGIVTVYNASSLILLDTNDDLDGRHIDDLLQLIDKDGTPVSLFDLLKTTKAAVNRDDLNYTYKDGEKIRLAVTYSPIRSSYSRTKRAETHAGYIVIMRDITKSKSLEEERDEFISVVSHELRTPITIVEGTISNVQVMMAHPDHTKQMLTDAIDMAHDQIIYLAKMVNDLSTLSRAERGVADAPEDIDVREMIHKLHEEYDKEASAKGLHFNLDLGATLGHVSTSRLYLEEMLQNFITNAIKYTKTGTVTMSVKQKLGDIKFSVKDSGIGISKSDQAKIYQKFYRSEDYRTRETNGTGLGLYVAAKLAHKVGTKIELVSRLNHGSTFSFSLPVKK
ncbi:MAG: putative Multi-sensor signal transduction histidine kinase [Candidatus Saccharibacteria bacterium]|nr:putative Multi-sensor signal transduction histidine kinase [Candidatus Saccharibacteria bacterium]